jgi:probable phosphoglycerate mutase
MELILIRHGLPERVENTDGTPADPPLTALGHRQASRMADWLANERIDRLYTSPMLRARQTALPLAERLAHEPSVDPRIAEFDRDHHSYVPLEELKRTDYPRWLAFMKTGWYSDMDPTLFRQEVVAAFEQFIVDNPSGRIAVFCHGGVINVWAAHLLGLERLLFFPPDYTSINRFRASRQGARGVVSLNETGHLRGLD